LPRWRGFNLLEKFTLAGNQPYQEWELDAIAEWGFNFVRLPLDYRIWTVSPGVYREEPLKELDQAIAWARARKIHVSLNLHRAPGYCVNPPAEPLDLWGDGAGSEDARKQFADQWRMFAARYRGIPSSDLSFNLLNEPPDISADKYVRAAAPAIAAIREEDAGRLIIADGLAWGRKPVPELVPLKVAQATRGYQPQALTHYRASWIRGADKWPAPTWPVPASLNGFLYGPLKK
jgi:endoglucanase